MKAPILLGLALPRLAFWQRKSLYRGAKAGPLLHTSGHCHMWQKLQKNPSVSASWLCKPVIGKEEEGKEWVDLTGTDQIFFPLSQAALPLFSSQTK